MDYKIITYPDGQINVERLVDTRLDKMHEYLIFRINSYTDLFVLRALIDAHRRVHGPEATFTLYIPCLFGQRSDRVFSETQSFGLKLTTDFINSMNLYKVRILDPHSDVSLALINRSEKVDPPIEELLEFDNNSVLVSPDAGAYKKLFKYAEKFNLPLVAANKFRDGEGKVFLNISGDVRNKECFIIDDLLDGGYTFHLLATELKALGAAKVYLYVSHAYFNKGVDFTTAIDHFYCTNSVKEIIHPKVTQYKIEND